MAGTGVAATVAATLSVLNDFGMARRAGGVMGAGSRFFRSITLASLDLLLFSSKCRSTGVRMCTGLLDIGDGCDGDWLVMLSGDELTDFRGRGGTGGVLLMKSLRGSMAGGVSDR